MADVLSSINTRVTPQSKQADPRQQVNNAGGFTFTISPIEQVRRFLTLGTDGGTYYVSAPDLTADNAKVVIALANTDHKALVDEIVTISEAGRAPKQNPAIFALAIAASVENAADRQYALSMLPRVCRTGTHLFLFAKYIEQFRGWGRSLRKAVGQWYLDKPAAQVAYQAIKYRQRDGWSHRDLLRLSHPETGETDRKALFEWIVRGTPSEHLPRTVVGHQMAQVEGATLPELVYNFRLPWEALPSEALNDAKVWEALINTGLPMTALIRQLPRLTKLGMFEDKDIRGKVIEQLTDASHLQASRIHPIQALIAQKTYASGRGRGSEWTPNRQIIDTLDATFYASFQNVVPTGKRTCLALDLSASMTWDTVNGLTPREISAAMSMVTAKTEEDYEIVGFTSGPRINHRFGSSIAPLSISPRQRLDDVVRTIQSLPAGGTDCALPMIWAQAEGRQFDTFVVYTDNETWAGDIHPHQAVRQYRERMDINAKLIVVAATATDFSIADPSDPGMLDVSGFDASVPNLISDFARAD